jgi:mevalonate kinase
LKKPTCTYSANGKLLFTGEYLVLDGADALAAPTKWGQHLILQYTGNAENSLTWESFNDNGDLWFNAIYDSRTFQTIETNNITISNTLSKILLIAFGKTPNLLDSKTTHAITTLDFDRNWGLGTSSTLISLVSQWSETNPYILLENSFGGSGYDIACATISQPIIYNINDKFNPNTLVLNTDVTQNYYFIYLNKKMNSREGIAQYKTKRPIKSSLIDAISIITKEFSYSKDLQNSMELIKDHEDIVASILEEKKVQDLYFSDFHGQIKSLGAWGGDFILAISVMDFKSVTNYFKTKGLNNCFKYESIIM